MYRPERLTLHPEAGKNRMPFEVAETTPVAGRSVTTGWVGEERITVITEPGAAPNEAKLYVEFPSEPDAVFPEE